MNLSLEAICQIYVERLLSFDDEMRGNLSVVYSLQVETSCLGALQISKFYQQDFSGRQTAG